MNFLEAVKALQEGRCEKIKSVKARTTYFIDGDNNDTLSLSLPNHHDGGICLRCESFLGEWDLIGVKHKIVLEDVHWIKGSNSLIAPCIGGSFNWSELVDKPGMKMTLEWIS